jgi:hypothetical protein
MKGDPLEVDSVFLSDPIIASALLHYSEIIERIDINDNEILQILIDRLSLYFPNRLYPNDSISIRIYDNKHAFSNNWGRKVNLFNDVQKGVFIKPYLELTVRTGPEFDGGGGISMAYPTGNRKYWITYGMIIEMQKDGRKFYSRGYYYTEFKKVPEETELEFTFPLQRIDSLISLCLKDFPLKEKQ